MGTVGGDRGAHKHGRPRPPFQPQQLSRPGEEAKLRPPPQYEGKQYRASDKLKGKSAFITGGDSGIGRSVAVLFAREGASVAITHLPSEASDARETAEAVEDAGQDAVLLELDVQDFEACQAAAEEVAETFGQIDILVNNAAYQRHVDRFEDISIEQWERTFRTNIFGYFHMVKACLPFFGDDATIINSGSITGLEGSKNAIDYASTKGAIHAFTKSLAQHLLERGIRVNCVAPGPVWTPLNPADRPEEKVAEFGAGTPMGRPAQPDEIAPSYVFFASDGDSSYITGEVLTLLGGTTRSG